MTTQNPTRTDGSSERPQAVLYCRVSTEEQAREGQSLGAQEANLRAYAALRGLDVVDVVVDAGVSAFKPLADREGGRRVLQLVKSGQVSAVIGWKLDRLFRNASNCLQVVDAWQRKGIALHLADMNGTAMDTSSAAGRMFLTMLAGFAEMERNLCSERIKAVLAQKRERGEYTGGTVPYGWRLLPGGDLEVDEGEQETIATAKDLHAAGLSLRKIGARLAELGRNPKSANTWHARTVQSLIKAKVG